MKARCHTPGSRGYERYGAKGITVCDEWRNDFHAFQSWALANGYSDELTIDRRENDKGYSPDTTLFGERKTVSQWLRDPRINATGHVYYQITRGGMTPEMALTSKA